MQKWLASLALQPGPILGWHAGQRRAKAQADSPLRRAAQRRAADIHPKHLDSSARGMGTRLMQADGGQGKGLLPGGTAGRKQAQRPPLGTRPEQQRRQAPLDEFQLGRAAEELRLLHRDGIKQGRPIRIPKQGLGRQLGQKCRSAFQPGLEHR